MSIKSVLLYTVTPPTPCRNSTTLTDAAPRLTVCFLSQYRVPESDAAEDGGALYEDGVYSDESANFASPSSAAAGGDQFSGSISSKMHAAGEQGWRDKVGQHAQ